MRFMQWVIAPATALLLVSGLLHDWRPQSQTHQVSSSVLFDGESNKEASPETRKAVEAEIQFVESEGFNLPPVSVSVVHPLGWNGLVTISDTPSKYSMVIVDWPVANSNRTRKTAAHEIGHILLAEKGLAQSEELADGFAACYGSPAAKAGAKELGISADCDKVRKAFQ